MNFDKSRVFTAVNADEVEVGSKGYFADCLPRLKQIVEERELGYFGTVDFICTDDDNHCFQSVDIGHYRYFYLEEATSEKHYHPYINAEEFISDYKKRFCPDCKGIPAIWVKSKSKSKSKAGALKQVIRIDNDIVIDDIITNGVWIATDRFFDFEDFFNTYTYPDGSPCGMEE